MSLLKKLAIPVLTASTLANSPTRGDLYDNFSSGTLNPALWQIRQDPEGQPLTELYGLENGSFFAQNITNSDMRTVLSLTGHVFQPGETLDYDVNYVSGTGNRVMVIFIDGGPLDRNNVGTIPYGGGSIGHNGQDFVAGNTPGIYHVRLGFQSGGLNVDITRPDNSLYTEFFQNSTFSYGGQNHRIAAPFNMGFETWSNGSIRAEYDNFYINEVPAPPAIGLLGLAGMAIARRVRKK